LADTLRQRRLHRRDLNQEQGKCSGEKSCAYPVPAWKNRHLRRGQFRTATSLALRYAGRVFANQAAA
jgi:hypothetical protein